jgi:polyphenol oxidase
VNPSVITPGLHLTAPAAFTTRLGGVSTGVFSALNFGNPGDLPADQRDPPANIRENLRRVATALGCEGRTIREVHQVHGPDVFIIRPGDPKPASDPKADALVTDDPALLLVIRVADCAPILLASGDGRIVAAVHAGWRGAVAKVTTRALEAMRQLGATNIHAAIGPCIGPDALEVGPEVIDAFRAAFGDRAAIRPHPAVAGKGFVDLAESLRRELLGASVDTIWSAGLCTVARPDLFFSHRRDAGRTGRMIGLIGPAR